MKDNKSTTIITVSTIIFGIISKWLVGIPYMILGHFDLYFIISFILWLLYSATLYIAAKIEVKSNDNFLKTGCYALLFGIIASCIKMGIDTGIMLIIGKTDNQILLTFVTELGILLLGSSIIIFLHYAILRKSFIWDKSLNKYAEILGITAGVYTISFFYFYTKFQSLALYTDVHSFMESESINLNTMLNVKRILQYNQIFTILSMIVSVIFFIVLWYMLNKCRKCPNNSMI